jgi:hypothetical protein
MQRIVSEYCWFKSSPDCNGGLAERLNAPVLKTGLRESVTGVRIPEPPHLRDVAQLVAHLVWDQGVAGSNPVIPTINRTFSSVG